MKKEFKLRMQPFVAYVEATEKVFVLVDECMYECSSVLHAIDSVFKVCMAYLVDFNFECSHIWEFLQIYIYEIKTKYDKNCKNTLTLMSSLKGLHS